MPVYQDKKTGKWYVSYRVKDPINGTWHQKMKRGFQTKRDAKIAEAELMQESNPSNKTFHQIADEHAKYMQFSDEVAKKHIAHYTIRFADLYDMPINKITIPMLVDWQNKLSETAFATRTKNDTIQYVRAVFKYANMVYGIPNISTVLNSIKKTDQEKMKEMQIWTIEEFNQFIEHVDEYYYKAFFILLFWTGMRRGECIALQKSDLQGNEISITKSMKHHKNGFKPTKTGKPRKIKIDSKTRAALEPLLKYEGNFIFGGSRSLPISSIQRKFKKAIAESGVKPIRIHDLRHSHASVLINSGVNIVAVSKRLGHSSIEMTLKVYTHLLEQTDNDMMNKIESLH